MRLTVEDIKRLNKEVEDAEIRAIKRYIEKLTEYKEQGYYFECLHEDAGDRI